MAIFTCTHTTTALAVLVHGVHLQCKKAYSCRLCTIPGTVPGAREPCQGLRLLVRFLAQREMQVVCCCALPMGGEESHTLPLRTSALKFPQFRPRARGAADGAEVPGFTLSVDLSFHGSG